jgi:hypothetical protein
VARAAESCRYIAERVRRLEPGGGSIRVRRARWLTRCDRRALEAWRLIAYSDLLIIGDNAHIHPNPRS